MSTETKEKPGAINIKIPPGRRHDLSLNINRTNIENYSARNINNDSVSLEYNFFSTIQLILILVRLVGNVWSSNNARSKSTRKYSS